MTMRNGDNEKHKKFVMKCVNEGLGWFHSWNRNNSVDFFFFSSR